MIENTFANGLYAEEIQVVTSEPVQIQREDDLAVDQFIGVLRRSTLAERRPVEDRARIAGMLQEADVIVTARLADSQLVGVSRAITDFHYCTYLSDLAVDEAYQRQGIGKKLLRATHHEAGLTTTLILLAAPAAGDYYQHVGMESHPSCWIAPGDAPLDPQSSE